MSTTTKVKKAYSIPSPISSRNSIQIKGARVHNLKNISVDFPRNKFIVVTGVSGSGKSSLTIDTLFAEGQRRYAESGSFARANHPNSADFILEQARKYPGQVTLVAIGPLPNIGAAIDKDLASFRKLKRVVIMGGNIGTLTDPYGVAAPIAPHPEWNIKNDIASAQKLFTAGVPLIVMPLDSTANLKLHEVARTALFAHGTMLTNILAGLYYVNGAPPRTTPRPRFMIP